MSYNENHEEILIDADPDEIDKDNSKSGNFSNSCRCWTATFLFWGSIIASVIKKELVPLIPLTYLIYIITICCYSPTITFLSFKEKETVQSKLEYIFSKNVIIEFTGESYHYETHSRTYTDTNGKEKVITWETKEITNTSIELYKYKSCIDVSGLLKFEPKKGEKKFFVKLKLIPDISFDSKESENDYNNKKEQFKIKAKRDSLFDFFEKKEIEDFTELHFLQLGNNNSILFNNCCFNFFLLLGLAQFYKLYVSSRCMYRCFTIKKIISAYRDLSSPENIIKYINQLPKVKVVDINDKTIESNMNNLNKIST